MQVLWGPASEAKSSGTLEVKTQAPSVAFRFLQPAWIKQWPAQFPAWPNAHGKRCWMRTHCHAALRSPQFDKCIWAESSIEPIVVIVPWGCVLSFQAEEVESTHETISHWADPCREIQQPLFPMFVSLHTLTPTPLSLLFYATISLRHLLVSNLQ